MSCLLGRMSIALQVHFFSVCDLNEAFANHLDMKNIRRYPRSIGDTKTLLGCYKLLAALRLLARWSKDKFRAWVLEDLCVQS